MPVLDSNPALASGARAALTPRAAEPDADRCLPALFADRFDAIARERQLCPACGPVSVVGPHRCAFDVAPSPTLPAEACCVVCIGHGRLLASHDPSVARISPARESAL
jgi:hypothetical protein